MPRELSKCRNWEKERRNRLNEAFSNLCKTLPCYDPAVNTSKIEILNNAKIHIEELETKIKNLLSENKNEASKTKNGEITKLQERIKKLLAKNEQLCSLLREAKISIPPGCGVVMKKFKSPLYWSNRITSEQAKILQQKELEKENNNAAADKKTRKLCITKAKAKNNQNNTPKHRKVMVNRLENKKIRVKRRKKPQQQQCLIVLTQSSIMPPQNCYVITANTPQTKTMNSTLLSTPIVSVTSKAAPKPIATIPSLGAGTLILANGTIMPVLPTQPTVLPQVINQAPQQQNPTVILVSKQAKVQNPCKSGKALAKIKPKYCLTQTTQVNKVPIPALTSRYANNKDLLSKEAKCAKKSEKKAQKKDSEENSEENVPKRKLQEDEQTENSAKKSKTDETNPETSKEASQPSNTESIDINTQPAAEKESIQEEKAQSPPPQTEIIAPPPTDPLPAVPEIVQEQKTLDKHVAEENAPTNSEMKNIELNINHSELSNDIFASLNVPSGCQNPESTSPTAAFLLAFPLVSTGVKVTEVTEDDNTESQRGTPTLLQIGTMDTTKSTQSHQADSFTPSLLNLDNLSFFSKDFYNSLENNLSSAATATVTSTITTTTSSVKSTTKVSENLEKETKLGYEPNKNELVSCFDGANQRLVQNQTYHVEKKQEVQKQNSCSNYVPHKTFASNANIGYFNESPIKTTTAYASGNVIKSYPDPLYTNSNSYTYSYSDTNFNQNYYKNIAKSDANHRSYYSLNYENYSDYHHRKNESTPNYYSAANSKKVATSSKPPINWMTAPDNVSNNNNHKDNDFGSVSSFNTFSNSAPQTNYFNSNSVYNNNELVNSQESMKKTLDLPLVGAAVNNYQRQETEENQQFAWSPTKLPQLLDHPHNFVSSTLPTLVGDLALGNSLFDKSDAKCLHKSSKQEPARRVKNYENQTNFLSVSQLVDHNNKETIGKSSRRSGTRPTNAAVKKVQSKNQSSRKNHHEKDVSKNTNNYSAEALIGHHQMPSDAKSRQNYSNSKSMSVPFLTDNILPYFPPVDLQQDNNYMQQNQNYQSTTAFGHNFSAGNNYSYTPNTFIPAATTITSTYLSSTNNFMHDSTATPHEYNDLFANASKEKNCNKNVNNQRNVQQSNVVCGNNVKKSKRKHHSNEQQSNLPNFVDFPFLSMPGAINSPILPDDFHSGFLPAPPPAPTTSGQLYSCKNPLYSKQNDLGSSSLLSLSRSNMAQEVSPSINSAGTSLTNFNLSTIFPEINNKSAIPDPSYLEPARIKDHGARGYASTAQVSFNEKPSFSFSYINSTSQSYNQLN